MTKKSKVKKEEPLYGSNPHLRSLGYFNGLYSPIWPGGVGMKFYRVNAEGPIGECSFYGGETFEGACRRMAVYQANPASAKYTDWLIVKIETAGRMSAIVPEDYVFEKASKP